MAPPAAGLAAVVRKYCVVKFAVYVVADEGAVIECDCAPPSDQLENMYWVPVAPGWGDDVTAIVWFEPGVHWKEQGAVHAVPSTVNDNPAGALAMLIAVELPVVSAAPTLKKVPGDFWLLYSVTIQAVERVAFAEILSSSMVHCRYLSPPYPPTLRFPAGIASGPVHVGG